MYFRCLVVWRKGIIIPMNKNDLFRTFADVNDDILERDETAEKKTCRLKWGVIAAFICLGLRFRIFR